MYSVHCTKFVNGYTSILGSTTQLSVSTCVYHVTRTAVHATASVLFIPFIIIHKYNM